MYKLSIHIGIFIALIAYLAAVVNAGDQQATSFVSFNDNHNSINHIQSASPHSLSPSYYASAPIVAKLALPAAAKVAAPASVYRAPASAATTYRFASPAVAAVPVAKYGSTPYYYGQNEEENYGPAQYEFAYSVQDAQHGDFHSQQEHREGDHVVGQYSLHEADGTVRIVKYSDDGHGFNAVVERQGQPTQEAPAVYKKILASAPHY
ncbi:hypothetical protein ABEB36_013100 [Hypothenemus hampei]|uniref:Uncharacterized protein n=1 Tax=Hypothenemus hampei TaxID=57062 RepID=A0ABD1E717_HYPHA